MVFPSILRDFEGGARQTGWRIADVWGYRGIVYPAVARSFASPFGAVSPSFPYLFWIFLIDAVALGYLENKPAEGVYVTLSRIATGWYFLHFLVILPLLSKV